jgi:hypothetical protein
MAKSNASEDTKTPTPILQFRITLLESDPLIWRRIEVPPSYSFWDLHVAVQDSMGWLDYHLHEFRFRRSTNKVRIGLPDEEDEGSVLPGWKVNITEYFSEPGDMALYEYDFGDSWLHDIVFERRGDCGKGVKYPRCTGGERACPPEDCGGMEGFENLLNILKNPRHEEFRATASWLRGHAKNYWPYEPNEFNPGQVHFDDPRKRFRTAFDK